MKDVALYLKARHAVRIEGLSERAAARRFGIDPRTVNKMMKFSVPPGCVRKKPPVKPKLDPFIPVIERILGDDKSRPKKQQNTAKRIFERLRDEHGFTGGITIVKDYVAGWYQRTHSAPQASSTYSPIRASGCRATGSSASSDKAPPRSCQSPPMASAAARIDPPKSNAKICAPE